MEVDEDGLYSFYAIGHPVNITVLDYGLSELNEQDEKEPREICEEAEVIYWMTVDQFVHQLRKENA